MKRMTLVLKAHRAKLIANGLRSAETGETADAAVVKIFDPCGRYTFYVFEAEEVEGDLRLYGFVVSPLGDDCDEWGYTMLGEIERTHNRLGLPMERDKYFAGVTREAINNGERP